MIGYSGVIPLFRADMPDQDVEFADLVGGEGNNRFALEGWTGDGIFAARGGFDTLSLKGTSGVVDVITITDTELTFGSMHFFISGFENLETDGITGEDTINVSGALMKSYTNKGSDADIRINLTGANFESLFNYGNQTNIRIDISGADFGNFTSLVNAGSGVKIDITGAIFESLVNTGADTTISIDLTGADFTAFQNLSNAGDNVRIDVTGADFGAISNSGKNVVIDLSGRPGLSFNVEFCRATIGSFDVDLVREFFQGLVNHAGITVHIDNLRGENAHHQAETIFKAFGRALRMAISLDPRAAGSIPSTKGTL